ncbi:hypothetical protein BDFB_007430, partial [Asbolus verrucosus]
MVYFYLPIGGHNDNIYYAEYLFERILPKYSAYLCYIYYATFPFLQYMMMFNSILLLYILTQLKFQIYFLSELMQNIGKDYNEIEDSEFMERQFNDVCYLPLIGCMGLAIVAFLCLFFSIIVRFLQSLKILENAANCRWTSWSHANRKSLLIVMTNAQKPFIIGTAFYICEYPFIITAGKFVSSVCFFFLELAKMRETQEMAHV